MGRVEVIDQEEEDCTTPKHQECRIPAAAECPPPPKKRSERGSKRDPPKSGYFCPPDIDALFSSMAPRPGACL
ncbi:hypothetical protein Vadar_025658 [Vaccinium darrowii]|uniref:Uncharacterized protein n=1 Tax=Vaccinium darrowii TaxID=229202 RepID=A0ACB7XUL6_9ERIC|nr:hypothetical protein Vadar_025658 [Vaccinium darrowii]